MLSKSINGKSFFHKGYFREMFHQLRVAGFISGGILCIFSLFGIIASIGTTALITQGNIIPSASSMAGNMYTYVYVMGFLLTLMAFGWLNKRASSDFYHSIPVKRTEMFFSTIFAVLLWMVIGMGASAVLTAIVNAVLGLPFNYLLYLCVVLNALIGAVMVVGAVGIAVSVSGTRFVNIVSALVIIFIPRLLIMVFSYFVYMDSNYMLSLNSVTFLFNPAFNIAGTWPYASIINNITGNAIDFANFPAMIYSLIYACLLIFAGWRLFNVRKSEAAGIPTTSPVLQAIFRCSIGMPFLLILAFIIREGAYSLTGIVILLCISFVLYCLYELISTKSAMRMVKAMPMFAICIALGLVFTAPPKWVSNAEMSIMVSRDSIKSYSVLTGSSFIESSISDFLGFFNDNTYSDLLLNEVKFYDDDSKAIIANAYNETFSNRSFRVDGIPLLVSIDRVKGKDLVRKIYLTDDQRNRLHDIWSRNNDYNNALAAYSDGKHYYSVDTGLTSNQEKEIGKLFDEEMRSLSKAERAAAISDGYSNGYCTISIWGTRGVDSYIDRYCITQHTPRTLKRYMEMCNADAAVGLEALERMYQMLKNNNEDEGNFYGNVYIYSKKHGVEEQISIPLTLSTWGKYLADYDFDWKMEADAKKTYDCLGILSKGTPTSDVENYVQVQLNEMFYTDVGGYTLAYNNIRLYLAFDDADMERLIEIALRGYDVQAGY